MWKDRFKNIFGETGNARAASPERASTSNQRSRLPPGPNHSAASITRHSSGAEQFFQALRSDDPLFILDLATASQANISFITEMGHKLSAEDILGAMDQCFGDGDFLENQAVPAKAEQFLNQVLNFPEHHFDGCLVWDTFQFLAPPLLEQFIGRLLAVMRPGGVLLAFFSTDEKITRMPVYSYRIQDAKTLLLVPRDTSRPVQYFNNRSVERLFSETQSVKFFLSRDHLREVIIRR
ncbi:MAG: class I SAM-dependent methyltransferase [Bryobacteraceae bacterium]